jgi:cell wall-associated NlpC family hydrolase
MRRLKLVGLLLPFAAAGCANLHGVGPAGADRHAARSASTGEAIALLARQMIGVPYRYGGANPQQGFDCSGLVYYSYARAGLSVPRSSRELFKAVRKIPLRQAAAGDIVFFQDQTKLSHVGIYLGNGEFIHAPSSGRVVSTGRIDEPYYQRHLIAVGRLLPEERAVTAQR